MAVGDRAHVGNAVLDALKSLPEGLAQAVRAACVPHRYSPTLLADLLAQETSDAETLFRTLAQMPFCRLHDPTSAEMHELAREAVLAELVRTDEAKYRLLSGRAADHFARFAQDDSDPTATIESIYNRMAADQAAAAAKLLELSDRWWSSREYQRTLALAQLGMEQARRGVLNAYTSAVVQYILGTSLALLYRYAESLVPLQAALDTVTNAPELQRRCIETLADVYYSLATFEKAHVLYHRALAIARQLDDRYGESTALGNLGNVYADLGQAEEAIGFYELALTISREIGDRRGEGFDLGNLGSACADLGRVEEAIGYYEQALAIHREIGDRPGEGTILGNLGSAYAALGQLEEGIGYFEQALAISREIGDRRREGAELGRLGSACADLGRVEEAIGYHEQAFAIHREIGDRRGEGNALGNLGNAYKSLGRLEAAIDYYEQAFAIHREIGDRRGEGSDLGNLGNAYAALGQVEEAIGYYEQALAIHREIGDRRGEGMNLRNLAELLIDKGRLEEAHARVQEAIVVTPEHPYTHARNAQLAFAERNDAAALAHHARAVELHAGHPTEFHFDRAMPLLRLGRADEALGLIRERLDAFEQPSDLEKMLNKYRRWAEQEPDVAGLAEAIRLLQERAASAPPHNPNLLESLTYREMDVLALLMQRLTNKEIAQELTVSTETVKRHLVHIFRKLHVENRREAIAQARRVGLFPPR